jgi:Fe-S oxidoreductase
VPLLARFGERLLGLSAKRTLPAFRRGTFLRDVDDAPSEPDVVLFVDTFTNYFEPENAKAAMNVLRAAGYRVGVARPAAGDATPRPLCCGRTYLAAGLVAEAKREARRLLDALAPHAERGATVVGLEPSCLLSLRDEYLALGLGEAAERVATRARLFEEFLAAERRASRLALTLSPLPQKRALLHGHCHQKAFDAMAATREALALIPELAVDVVESGCCGMAGSFGFDAAHYDVSLRMAELSLLPAMRAASPDTLLVADGTSCRHQIADGTRANGVREAIHVARALERALGART